MSDVPEVLPTPRFAWIYLASITVQGQKRPSSDVPAADSQNPTQNQTPVSFSLPLTVPAPRPCQLRAASAHKAAGPPGSPIHQSPQGTTAPPPSRRQLPRKHKPPVRAGGRHSPLCPSVLLWIKIVGDFPKLGEDLMDDVFEFLQAVGPHLRHVVNHNHRVDPVCFLRPVFEHVPQQLCGRGRCAEWFSLTKLMRQVSTLNKSPKSEKCIINLNAFAPNIKILQPWLDWKFKLEIIGRTVTLCTPPNSQNMSIIGNIKWIFKKILKTFPAIPKWIFF